MLIRPDDDLVVGLNLLDVAPGENAEMVADQTAAVFRRVLQCTGGANAWGPRMDVVLGMAILTLMKHPGSTLCDLPALLGPDRAAGAAGRRDWTIRSALSLSGRLTTLPRCLGSSPWWPVSRAS